MIKVGVIILNWNCAVDTIKCVESLNLIKSCKLDILVIDNNSINKDVALLKKLSGITLICNSTNYGYAKGINQGIKFFLSQKKKYEYILQMNNDSYGTDDFLKPMLATMTQNEKVGSVGPLIYAIDVKNKVLGTGGLINKNNGLISNDHFWKHQDMSPYGVDWVSGCVNLTRTSAILETGYLNESYGSYVEDVEYSFRLKKHGYELMIDPKSKIFHGVSKSSGGDYSLLKRYLISRNSVMFSKKYLGWGFLFKNIFGQLINCRHYPPAKIVIMIYTTINGFLAGIVVS